jgi:RNA polymerase sigma factor (sigma-70 family)
MPRPAGSLLPQLRALLGPARPETASDGQLLARWVADHDSQAFAALVWRHGALAWRVGRSILHQREDAEDAFQATFLVLARKAASLQGRASIAGWLHNTAHRLALKARSAAARRRRREDQAAKTRIVDPLEEISVREARTIILEQELDRLPAAYREPLLLCLYEGSTHDEAAKRLGCSLNTLKRRLDRGRDLLGRRLARRGLTSESALALTLCSLSKAPVQLVLQTLNAAEQYAAGHVLTGSAVVLAESVLGTVLLKKVAVCVTAMPVIGGLTLAGGFAYSPAARL